LEYKGCTIQKKGTVILITQERELLENSLL
jgi:hypothetical protein